jgi:hypothetical protein
LLIEQLELLIKGLTNAQEYLQGELETDDVRSGTGHRPTTVTYVRRTLASELRGQAEPFKVEFH